MRSGVQLLVIGLIVIVGGGLLAAGIVRLRQTADRSECQGNLKILATALHDYHDTNLTFPSALWAPGMPDSGEPSSQNPPLPPEKRLSWFLSVLPFLEQQGGTLLLDARLPWDSPENCPPRIRRAVRDERGRENGEEPEYREGDIGAIKVWLCPANPSREPPGMPAFTHYVGIAGLGEDAARLQAYDPQAGLFGYNRRTSLKDIQRGTGHTIMVIETAWQNGPWTAGGFPTTRGLVPGGQPYLGPGGQFGGSHPGGGWALFADGSVRFLTDAISPEVLEDLATVRGGSPAGED